MAQTKPEYAIYGNVALPRAYCEKCDCMAFALDGVMQCCGDVARDLVGMKLSKTRESDAIYKRKKPRRADQKRILREQSGCCFWCRRELGGLVQRNGYPVELMLNWDHLVPLSYSYDNNGDNFVAACHICNAYKSNLVMGDEDALRGHINDRWVERGWRDIE